MEIEKINEFIENNLKKEFSLTDIANHTNYSAYHLAREYKKLTGYSIMDYVRERKVFEAAKAIADGDSVLETALDYRFDTHSGSRERFRK